MSTKKQLPEILKKGRTDSGLTQTDVSRILGLSSAQSISDWERGYASSIPIQSLKKLVTVYRLNEKEVFDALFEYEMEKLKEKLDREFYGVKSKRNASG